MDFVRVLQQVTAYLESESQPWVVVGGVALAAYGIARTTLDLDLATDRAVRSSLIPFLERAGYRTLYRSEGFSNHLHADEAMGRLDLMYLSGETARRIFSEARALPGPGGLEIRVPRCEHLIAMKAQALRDDPTRQFRELADIRALVAMPQTDRREVRQWMEEHGLADRWKEIERTL